ncbi:MAG: alpha-2-macroglobulin family protein, partial [Planctomycetota bacterium]
KAAGEGEATKASAVDGPSAGAAPGPDLSKVSARKNLNETAFFFPHLIAGDDGTVKLEFTMPEALTEWKFLGFAHDKDLRGGLLTDKVVTAKDLMVQPNPPRFVREGDVLEFTVKVSNQSPTRQTGKVRLGLSDARTAKPVDDLLGNVEQDLSFDIPAGESKSLAWRLSVPDDLGFLTYKAVGSTGKLSDGEEGFLPVLSRRILVTESLPLPIRGKQTKEFDFTKLRESGKSDTLKHQSLTVQMVSNPSWYAVMALPYLMEFPYECTEQTFNRLYANSLARHIAGSDPKIHRVFEQWRGTPALDSPLEKNQDLKAVLIEETPWLRQAEAESQARRNVGILFDDNRLNDETARLLQKLSDQQLGDGAWPWFPGGPANDYITLYITTGFGRLRHLGVKIDTEPALKSLARLDAWVTKIYNDIPADQRDKNHLSTTIAFYLYGRSFFLEDQAIADPHKEAVNYWLGQAKKYWLELAVRQSQGHLAVALKRFGDLPAAQGIMASIKERSVSDEELGMFWRELELSWWWYRAPIETQAMMIEAFDEVMNDQVAVEDCKVWLLKQKQTQDWKTTKATADAIYALLLRGSDLLASDALVEVTLGGQTIKPEDAEAGTGFYEQRFGRGEIEPQQGQITVKKIDDGVAWGSVHWQYLEDMSKITPYEGTPLTLTKQLYTKVNTKKGPELKPVAGPIEVGDELVVRIVLKTDRDMEYVHLKDYRGSGTEPVNVLSQYKYQDGLAYYESTRDTASHFFIDYLPKGTYVFEYSTRVQLRGSYQTGVAGIQCMYAPEFNSHSESLLLEVK